MPTAVTITPLDRTLTEEDFLNLPRDGRKWELVGGKAKEVPTKFRHDEIGVRIIELLLPYVRRRGSMSSGQAGFRMSDGNIRCPDVSFTLKERLPGGRAPDDFGAAAPDLCVEIISPSEEPDEMRQKLEEYFASGAQIVWHVFPETKQVTVYTPPAESKTLEAEQELTGGEVVPGFACRVAELFEVD